MHVSMTKSESSTECGLNSVCVCICDYDLLKVCVCVCMDLK